MHKAVGWMLREVGKRCSQDLLKSFLAKHILKMRRTTLRYAIEHFPKAVRQNYLKRS
jgi:3-methyladenine DNA glycosylase AlkD